MNGNCFDKNEKITISNIHGHICDQRVDMPLSKAGVSKKSNFTVFVILTLIALVEN